jgi:hypothetical protein
VGAFVVFDPYWDPLEAFEMEAEAKTAIESQWPDAHYFWVERATTDNYFFLATEPKPWEDE